MKLFVPVILQAFHFIMVQITIHIGVTACMHYAGWWLLEEGCGVDGDSLSGMIQQMTCLRSIHILHLTGIVTFVLNILNHFTS